MQILSKCRYVVTAQFSQLTNKVLTLRALIITCSGVHCGLKCQHWPMKRTLVDDQKGCPGVLYPYNSDETNAQKWRYPQKSMFTATVWPTDMPLVVLA